MTRTLLKIPLFPGTIFFFFFSILLCSATAMEEDLNQIKEKRTRFILYWHDQVSGRDPTSIPIHLNVTQNGFGFVSMIDDKLTQKPSPKSKLLGRAQGFYAASSLEDFALLMVMNFYFTTGKYNGSAISILGRNAVLSPVREMAVVGGTGLFRLARGYALARTHTLNNVTGDAIVKYDVTVLHY